MLTAAGHTGETKHIIPHPTIYGFVSVGADNVMQLWNCTLRNKTSKVQLESEVKFVKLNESEKCITTLTTNLTRWEMNSLYTFLSAL
ncbi:unnamed protein product, partial [Timema podura]|nr:unnamed protein product [Timema podura]